MTKVRAMGIRILYIIRIPIRWALGRSNLRVVRNSSYSELIAILDKYQSITRWVSAKNISDAKLLRFMVSSIADYPQCSQLQQDLMAQYIATLTNSQNRFFVEFGACDGVTYSNSYLLEKHFEWSGILAEPGKNWHEFLSKNRKATVSKDCVWSATGEILKFAESKNGEYSTIRDFVSKDSHFSERKNSKIYEVKTVSLDDLLSMHDAPQHINFMSIDTEGSEYEILRNFDIGKYKIDFISIEHNYTANREFIHEFMCRNDFVRILESMSAWEDWYVPTAIFNLLDLHDNNIQ